MDRVLSLLTKTTICSRSHCLSVMSFLSLSVAPKKTMELATAIPKEAWNSKVGSKGKRSMTCDEDDDDDDIGKRVK